jgi:hypothetical protein
MTIFATFAVCLTVTVSYALLRHRSPVEAILGGFFVATCGSLVLARANRRTT